MIQKKYRFSEAVKLIGNGATYRTVTYYVEQYPDELIIIGKTKFVTENFINKVKRNRELNSRERIEEPRTKSELLKVIKDLEEDIKELKEISLNISGLTSRIEELEKENAELKEELAEYENSEVFEKADAGMRVEVFTEAEYKMFEETLIHYKVQAKEIEMQEIRFDSLKDERDYLRSQYEYALKSKDRILQMHESLIEAIKERNYIEAVEKGATPKQPKDI